MNQIRTGFRIVSFFQKEKLNCCGSEISIDLSLISKYINKKTNKNYIK